MTKAWCELYWKVLYGLFTMLDNNNEHHQHELGLLITMLILDIEVQARALKVPKRTLFNIEQHSIVVRFSLIQKCRLGIFVCVKLSFRYVTWSEFLPDNTSEICNFCALRVCNSLLVDHPAGQ